MRYRFSLLLLIALAAAGAADPWPQFRGPTGDGIARARDLPTRWSEGENVLWKTAIPGKAWSSPVVWGEQVWVTNATEDGKELSAVCVDRRSGKVVHNVLVFAVDKPAFCHAFNSHASPTPVIEEGRLYAHYGSAGTACLDTRTGKVLWQRRDLPCDHFRGPGSSPVVYGDRLFLIFDGFDHQYVAALDKGTGKTLWKKDRGIAYPRDDGDFKKAYATPSVLQAGGKAQLVCPSAEFTIAYDAASGEELWRVRHGGMNVAARPIFHHGLVYLTSGHPARLLAVRQGGNGDRTTDGVAWSTIRSVPSRPSLLVIDDLLYMVSDNGLASCLEAKTGKLVWQERLGGAFSSSPVFAGGRLYFADEAGKTHVLAAGRTFQVVAVNKLDAGCMASPAVAEDTLILRTRTHLYCIGRR
jgi:hypothetical protein